MSRLVEPISGEIPRVKFCWICSRKLRGNHFVYLDLLDGNPKERFRIVHKSCGQEEVEYKGYKGDG